MPIIKMEQKGSFKNTKRYFKKAKDINPRFREVMRRYGDECVAALAKATPKATGETASMWRYEIRPWGLDFFNDNVNGVQHIAILLQYGHATRSGGFIAGIDYINPALKPIFDKISKALREEVKRL